MKYHVLFSVSALIAHMNGQPQTVPDPSQTLPAACRASELLPHAATCVDKALHNAIASAQAANKVFSPQNWLKRIESVRDQLLVASTIASLLPTLPNGKALADLVHLSPAAFQQRWSAE